MGEQDAFLDTMKNSVDKWMGAEPEVNIFGQKVRKNPDYISISYKEKNQLLWTFVNGAADDVAVEDNYAGYSIDVCIGDEDQGFGRARAAREDIARDSRVMADLLDDSMDTAVKVAVSSYLNKVSSTLIHKEDIFYSASEEDISKHIGPKAKEISTNGGLGEILKDFTGDISKRGLVREVSASVVSNATVQRFTDSDGRKIREASNIGRIYISGAFRHNDRSKLSHLESMTFFGEVDNQELESMMNRFCCSVEDLKVSDTPVSGEYPVILTGEAVGTLIHEGLGGHLLSGYLIQSGISSTFKDRIDTLVLPEFMTVIDDPRMEGASGRYFFDDEGIASKRTVLIEDGMLRNYLLDRKSAKFFGMGSNGHSRMEWVMDSSGGICIPEPRVSNLDIRSNNAVSPEELEYIARKHCVDSGAEYVLHVDSHAGEVDVQSSKFNMYPSTAHKIYPDGRREPAHNFFISGGAYELLSQIMVTDNVRKIVHGNCGSTSGWIPTQNTAPAAFFPKVNIQGLGKTKYTESLL